MKLKTAILFISLLLALTQSMSVRQNAHQNLKNHHNKVIPLSHNDEYDSVESEEDYSDLEEESSNEQHLQDPASAAAAAAATEATKYLMSNPEQAAQIPTKLITGQINGLITTFEGAWNIKDRTRSLQLTFSNLLQQKVVYDSDYFDSGTWYRNWQPEMAPLSINQGEVANKQGSFFTGVTGGIKLRILAGNGRPEAFIYLGFNNPYIGSYKHFAEISTVNRPAKYGYDVSVTNSPKNIYALGYRIQVVQTPSTITQMAFVYQISYA